MCLPQHPLPYLQDMTTKIGTWCQTRTDIVLRVKEMHNLSAQPGKKLERGRRIELLALAWKAKVLPLYEPRLNT
jgi:hypothetical protein